MCFRNNWEAEHLQLNWYLSHYQVVTCSLKNKALLD